MNSLDIVKEFVKLLIKEYELNEDELIKLWTDAHPVKVEKLNPYTNKKTDELKELCRSKGLPVSGSKKVLIERLMNPPAVKTKSKTRTKKKQQKISDILQKVVQNTEVLNIRRNLFNNFEHAETSFVFNEDKMVVGKQDNSGSILPLTEEDINTCIEYNFLYQIPTTIDDVE